MKEILDEAGIRRSLIRITHEILERNKGVDDIILVGIVTRGESLAKRLAQNIETFEKKQVECVSLDISYWRDDFKKPDIAPDFTLDVQNKKVILVDDVLFKGRTVRAAMDAIMSFGRAKEIQLAVLVDRGHRELPIRADYVGKNIPSAIDEIIKVKTMENDGMDGIYISEKEKV